MFVIKAFYVAFIDIYFLYSYYIVIFFFFFFQAEDGIRDWSVTGVQTCALPILMPRINVWTRPKKTNKGWAVILSGLVQTFILGILILIPLIYTEALPKAMLSTLDRKSVV